MYLEILKEENTLRQKKNSTIRIVMNKENGKNVCDRKIRQKTITFIDIDLFFTLMGDLKMVEIEFLWWSFSMEI